MCHEREEKKREEKKSKEEKRKEGFFSKTRTWIARMKTDRRTDRYYTDATNYHSK